MGQTINMSTFQGFDNLYLQGTEDSRHPLQPQLGLEQAIKQDFSKVEDN
jgi:hypothetical protein